VRANRMLRSMRRGLETGSRCTLPGHEGGNSGYRQEFASRVTAPVLDPTEYLAGTLTTTRVALKNWKPYRFYTLQTNERN